MCFAGLTPVFMVTGSLMERATADLRPLVMTLCVFVDEALHNSLQLNRNRKKNAYFVGVTCSVSVCDSLSCVMRIAIRSFTEIIQKAVCVGQCFTCLSCKHHGCSKSCL